MGVITRIPDPSRTVPVIHWSVVAHYSVFETASRHAVKNAQLSAMKKPMRQEGFSFTWM